MTSTDHSEHDLDVEALRTGVREVLSEAASSERVRRFIDSGDAFDQDLWTKAAELGWFALTAPEEHGGLDLGFAAAAMMYEELGRVVAPLPMLETLLAIQAIMSAGDVTQQAEWLPRLAAGELPAAISAGGLTPAWDDVRITNRGSAILLDGAARNLLGGGAAKLLLIAARDESGAACFVLVVPETDGVAVESVATVDGTRCLGEAHFKKIILPVERVLTADGETLAADLQVHASLALACDSVGAAAEIFAQTVEYLKTREQFGKPIGSFQALKHRCADHKVKLEATSALLSDAVRRWAGGDADVSLCAGLAKAHACDAFASIATDCVQLHGGIGFTWEHVCHLYLKRATLNQALFGRSNEHRDHAARLLLAA